MVSSRYQKLFSGLPASSCKHNINTGLWHSALPLGHQFCSIRPCLICRAWHERRWAMAPRQSSSGAARGVHHQVWCQLQDIYGEYYLHQEDTTCSHHCCLVLRAPIVLQHFALLMPVLQLYLASASDCCIILSCWCCTDTCMHSFELVSNYFDHLFQL